jgi:hypothetical protein
MAKQDHSYQPPTLTDAGDFREVTRALAHGICTDILGWGYAVICIW